MRLTFRFTDVRKIRIVYPETTINTTDYPELEGKTLSEIRMYIEKHSGSLRATDERFDSLLEQMEAGKQEYFLGHVDEETEFYVRTETDEGTDEEE